MQAANRVPPLLLIPPPLLFVATFFAGIGLQKLVPVAVHSAGLLRAEHLAGEGLVGTGALLALTCLGMFLLARTTLIPFGAAARLLTGGPYRFTRNPMYLSLVVIYLGVAGLLGQLWPLLLLPLPVALVHRRVIPFEEARMRERFGSAFEQYCARVRRWI